jgi:hypothetical protein
VRPFIYMFSAEASAKTDHAISIVELALIIFMYLFRAVPFNDFEPRTDQGSSACSTSTVR